MNDSFPDAETSNGMFPKEQMQKLTDSSLPIGKLAKKTKGRQPRTREASTREAMSRDTEVDFAKFDRMFELHQFGPLYMPPEATPKGWVGMWVRTGVRGKRDYSNVQERIRFGWVPPSSGRYPSFGFENVYGDVVDDQAYLERPGLIWMLRPEELHKREQAIKQRKVEQANHFNEAARKMGATGVEGGYVTGRNNGQQVTFSSDPRVQYLSSSL